MKVNYVFFVILITLTISACKQNAKTQEGLVWSIENANFTQWDKIIKIDDIIPLQETDNSIISIVSHCFRGENFIAIFDHRQKRIMIFDNQGNYSHSIGHIGNAVSEYINAKDIIITDNNTRFEILDESGIIAYDAMSGEFIKKQQFSDEIFLSAQKFAKLPDSTYLFFTPNNTSHTVYHRNADGEYIGLRESTGAQLVTSLFSTYNGVYKVLPNYGMYQIDEYRNDELHHCFTLDFMQQKMPLNIIPKDSQDFRKVDEMDSYFKAVCKLSETQKHLYLQVVGPSQQYYDIYINKENGNINAGKSDIRTSLFVYSADTQYFYGLIYPEYLSEDSPYFEQIQPYIIENKNNPLFIKFSIEE